jgi:hypothetical protein
MTIAAMLTEHKQSVLPMPVTAAAGFGQSSLHFGWFARGFSEQILTYVVFCAVISFFSEIFLQQEF